MMRWNDFISNTAKAGAILDHVATHGDRAYGMSAAALQVWQALVTIGAVRPVAGGYRLTRVGDALRAVISTGEVD